MLAGFMDAAAADAAAVRLVPLVRASSRGAGPGLSARDLHPANRVGAVTAEAYSEFTSEMVHELHARGPFDGVLVTVHGCGVSELSRDMDGELCALIRETVGAGVTVGVCVDMHANISQLLVDSTDICVVWRTTPHVDMKERGRTTAELVFGAVRGEIDPVQWLEKPPLIVNVTQHYTEIEPMLSVCSDCISASSFPGILDTSVAVGSPYSDAGDVDLSNRGWKRQRCEKRCSLDV